LGETFDIIFLRKHFGGVFELALPGNAQKRTPKKQTSSWLVGGCGVGLGFRFSQCKKGLVGFVL
jgi:hypothetical protein